MFKATHWETRHEESYQPLQLESRLKKIHFCQEIVNPLYFLARISEVADIAHSSTQKQDSVQWHRRSLSRLCPQPHQAFSQPCPNNPSIFSCLGWSHKKSISTTVKISLFIYAGVRVTFLGLLLNSILEKISPFVIKKNKPPNLVVLGDIQLCMSTCAYFSVTYSKDADITYVPRRCNWRHS